MKYISCLERPEKEWLRKWLTNDKDLRDKISAIENFSAKNTTSESKHMLAADSDERYAKQTLGIGSKLNSGHEKVLGLSWDIESERYQGQGKMLRN